MKRFALSAVIACLAFSAAAQQAPAAQGPTKAESAVETYLRLRGDAPLHAGRIGFFLQLARLCGIPDKDLTGAADHLNAYIRMGDAEFQSTLVNAFNKGAAKAAKNPLSTKECRDTRSRLLAGARYQAESAVKVQSIMDKAYALAGNAVGPSRSSPIATPPGQAAAPAVRRPPTQ